MYLNTLQATLQLLQQDTNVSSDKIIEQVKQTLEQQINTDVRDLEQQYNDKFNSERIALQQQ